MTVVGISYSTGDDGQRRSTLYVTDEFNGYYINHEAGRGCVGKKTDAIYVGAYDCSALKVGMEIEVYFDKAVSTAKGSFQNVKKIEIINVGKKVATMTRPSDTTTD